MRLNHKERWTTVDTISIIVAGLLILSPWMFRYTDSAVATWSAILTGILLVAIIVTRVLTERDWQDKVDLALGIWACVAPWVLGFSAVSNAAGMHVTAGLVVAVMAAIHLWIHYLEQPSETA